MKKTKKAFDIPAIDNQQCALGIHLGMDSMNLPASELPTRIGESYGIHIFEHAGERYHVASAFGCCKIVHCDIVIQFNGSLWGVSKAA